jgi:molecular chaperone Hsp33
MNRENTVRQAGGFIIQLMPFAEENVIERLETNLSRIHSVTALLDEGYTPEQLLDRLLEGMEPEITDTMPVQFLCNCSKERVKRALVSIGRADIEEMIADGKDIEVNCHFCNRNYVFSIEELKKIKEESGR